MCEPGWDVADVPASESVEHTAWIAAARMAIKRGETPPARPGLKGSAGPRVRHSVRVGGA